MFGELPEGFIRKNPWRNFQKNLWRIFWRTFQAYSQECFWINGVIPQRTSGEMQTIITENVARRMSELLKKNPTGAH